MKFSIRKYPTRDWIASWCIEWRDALGPVKLWYPSFEMARQDLPFVMRIYV